MKRFKYEVLYNLDDSTIFSRTRFEFEEKLEEEVLDEIWAEAKENGYFEVHDSRRCYFISPTQVRFISVEFIEAVENV